MNMRLIAFSLTTAVGICLATSQLTADEIPEACVFCGDSGCAERVIEAPPTQLADGLVAPEECHFHQEADCFDVLVDETFASGGESEDLGGGLHLFVFIDDTCEYERIAVAEAAGTNDFEAVYANAEVSVPASEVPVAEATAGPSEEDVALFADNEVAEDFECVEGFEGWIVERDTAAEVLIQEETLALETAEDLANEASVQIIEPVSEAASVNDIADAIEVAGDSDPDLTEDFVAEDLVAEPESVCDEADIFTDEIIEEEFDGTGSESDEGETIQQLIEELTELIDEEAVPEADKIAEADDVVVENAVSVEVAQPLAQEAGLPESESAAINEVEEPQAGTVRTIELGDCKVIIQSDRQIDDYELLEMLWQAASQLEVAMD